MQYVEPSGVGADLVFKVKKVFSVQSRFQKIDVLRSDFFGNILTIDDDLMLTERDELLKFNLSIFPGFDKTVTKGAFL